MSKGKRVHTRRLRSKVLRGGVRTKQKTHKKKNRFNTLVHKLSSLSIGTRNPTYKELSLKEERNALEALAELERKNLAKTTESFEKRFSSEDPIDLLGDIVLLLKSLVKDAEINDTSRRYLDAILPDIQKAVLEVEDEFMNVLPEELVSRLLAESTIHSLLTLLEKFYKKARISNSENEEFVLPAYSLTYDIIKILKHNKNITNTTDEDISDLFARLGI